MTQRKALAEGISEGLGRCMGLGMQLGDAGKARKGTFGAGELTLS